MKAALLEKLNQPLSIVDREIPEPGENEVVIKQDYAGLCYRDILSATGFFPRIQLPIIPGHEIGGTVVKTGSEVRNFHVGDHVASLIYIPCGKCEYCRSGNENLCPYKKSIGEEVQGGFREYVNVPEISLISAPKEVDTRYLPIASCVTGMIYHALFKLAKVKEGQRVLITGAGGGVGSNAVQMAKAFGATVIAETTSESKKEMLEKIGADYIVDGNGKFNEDVKKIGGADIVLECVGIHTFERSLRSLNNGGKMIVIGNIKPDPVNLPLGLIILKGNTIRGSISSTRKDVSDALKMVAENRIKPVIGSEVSIDRINEAMEMMKNKQTEGRVLIKFS
ncbi:alcohol dehydrogenase related protein [Thermoplasma acidophilum]|uniref:Alcohol dehydrogenase related protein n=1 Tax=Thermoplasma acidophilum (strain ATCC 25905 / DSM 1728 / JCM 9062 / NBRC 15155 / AMRC-C165) TaxID=273075 RepID=Q9HJX2_THEAC|nr:alcohol dehydrogenase catalytic domain-containing protein [Thermoplasma acidophilum]MCY0851204.1 alcohol dehydrogenase catalytic domain-containing protein [Thermoplasma acidophilum]CAC11970.1 alcohol dehydrogenase related protein [Thermoplasma acidophilum]